MLCGFSIILQLPQKIIEGTTKAGQLLEYSIEVVREITP